MKNLITIKKNFAVLAITESWLNSNIASLQIEIYGYYIFRLHRFA